MSALGQHRVLYNYFELIVAAVIAVYVLLWFDGLLKLIFKLIDKLINRLTFYMTQHQCLIIICQLANIVVHDEA